MAELLGKIVAFSGMIILIIPVLMLLGALMGGISGAIIGWAFPYVFDAFRELSGLGMTNFQLGATLGVFGSAFRSHNFSD
ncbi:MAG: hypothetical protein ACYSUK_11125 [Planctomycetota bacterium]|jgi:hypothetical protein